VDVLICVRILLTYVSLAVGFPVDCSRSMAWVGLGATAVTETVKASMTLKKSPSLGKPKVMIL